MPYTRPGVEASVRLYKAANQTNLWRKIEAKYHDMLVIKKKGDKELLDLDSQCDELGNKWRSMIEQKNKKGSGKKHENSEDQAFITCGELYTVMKWKFSKGKSRPLWKHINSNSEETVRECSMASFSHVSGNNSDINEALKEMSKLKGVGPASSSAILSLFRPDLFVFMDDEVIECLHEGKRDYSLKIYLEINEKCQNLAESLGEGWNVRRVGKALWTAAIISAYSDEEDLTLASDDEKKNDSTVDEVDVKDDVRKSNRKSKRRKLK